METKPRKLELWQSTCDVLRVDPAALRALPDGDYRITESELSGKLGMPIEEIRKLRNG